MVDGSGLSVGEVEAGLWNRSRHRQVGRELRDADDECSREAVVGQWALIADNSREAKSAARIMTNNVRSESLASRPTIRGPWARGQRCLIPADSFLEPNWESGTNEWWRFRRIDGAPWGLTKTWLATCCGCATSTSHRVVNALKITSSRRCKPTKSIGRPLVLGDVVRSFGRLDTHALMRRMHKPHPKYGQNEQDKRSVVVIEATDFSEWLSGTVDDAKELIRLVSAEIFDAGPDRCVVGVSPVTAAASGPS